MSRGDGCSEGGRQRYIYNAGRGWMKVQDGSKGGNSTAEDALAPLRSSKLTLSV